jgi:hypothetical protein
MKKIILIAILPFLFSCKSQLENGIKQSSFEACPGITVEKLFNKFLKNPEWESFISPDDNKYHLNVSGKFNDAGVVRKLNVQFQYTEGEMWEINAIEMDGETLSDEMILNFLGFMCETKNG